MTSMTPPDGMTVEHVASIADEDLAGELYEYVLALLGEQDDNPALIALLPDGLRAAYVLVVLDSEVQNGGFYQFFTNSSGRHANEALTCLRMIGAERHVDILTETIEQNQQLEAKYPSYRRRWEGPQVDVDATELAEFWSHVETTVQPVLDRLDEQFYELEGSDSFWSLFVEFVRSDPEKCVHRGQELL